jgi:hypothetical protein
MKISMANNERTESERLGQLQVEIARKCLGLIRDIAERGAASWDPAHIGYALQELSQVLLERTGTEDRKFEPAPANEIPGLDQLYLELQWVDGFSEEMSARKLYN